VSLSSEVELADFGSITKFTSICGNFVHFQEPFSVPRGMTFLYLNLFLVRWHNSLFGTYFGMFLAVRDEKLSYLENWTIMGKSPLRADFGQYFHGLNAFTFLFYYHIRTVATSNMGSKEFQVVLCPSVVFWYGVKVALYEGGS